MKAVASQGHWRNTTDKLMRFDPKSEGDWVALDAGFRPFPFSIRENQQVRSNFTIW